MKKIAYLPLVVFIIAVFYFFSPFVIYGKLPIPADTIIGLFHPYRDLYSTNYPNGIPYKNSLITDPVEQQYPWRSHAIQAIKTLHLPLWNPYSFSGTPLLANMQSGVFYPLNIFLLILPMHVGWGILILLEPLLAGIFFYFYVKNLNLSSWASLIGAITFSFSGYAVAWMEWGTIGHVALWLPLILLSVDKIFFYLDNSSSSKFIPPKAGQNAKLQFKIKNYHAWFLVFLFSLVSSFFGGHLQTFFYLFIITQIYFFARWIQFGRKKNIFLLFIILNSLFIILTAIQWIPTFQFISLSAREIDQNWQKAGWFIPWQQLIQFLAPDYFGNPTTLNYWGVWNYGEFIGYAGIIPLIMGTFALFFRKDKKTLFFGTIFFLSLLFGLPTIFAKIPYLLNIPLLSTSMPTRLLFITDFSLAVLSALGFDFLLRTKKKEILYPIGVMLLFYVAIAMFTYISLSKMPLYANYAMVAKRNLVLPMILFAISSIGIIAFLLNKNKYIYNILLYLLITITIFDLLHFAGKFLPFTNPVYLFPQTKIINFLQKNENKYFRVMSDDRRIFPPNFSVIYKIQSIDGYDPLYLRRYGEMIAASERGNADISPPFGFDRIITPHNYDSKIVDLLGVKYVLSLSDLQSPKLQKVFQEGQTRVYENKNVLPRVFFAEEGVYINGKQEVIKKIFSNDLLKKVFIEDPMHPNKALEEIYIIKSPVPLIWRAAIVTYSENKIVIKTETNRIAWLVLTDSFYPSWKATIDGREKNIVIADYNFRGIIVPDGKHTVEFYATLF